MAITTKKNKNQVSSEHDPSPILQQMAIFSSILFASSLIKPLFPKSFPVPTPVIGLILLYLLLATHIIKLYQIEKMADFLISLIAFLFVPSGVQMAASLNVFSEHGMASGGMMIVTIILATIILLVVIAFTTACFMWISKIFFHKSTDV